MVRAKECITAHKRSSIAVYRSVSIKAVHMLDVRPVFYPVPADRDHSPAVMYDELNIGIVLENPPSTSRIIASDISKSQPIMVIKGSLTHSFTSGGASSLNAPCIGNPSNVPIWDGLARPS